MRVVIYPTDRFACGHYRMYWPAEVLGGQGLDVRVVDPSGSTGIGALKVNGDVVHTFAPDCDVVVLQRPARKLIADLVPGLRARGVAVVVDMDDDLAHIHPSNPAWRGMHPRHSPDYNFAHARRACAAATLVTVSTPALLPLYAPHGRGRVVYNHVPRRYLDAPRDPAEASVGWAGSLHSHPDDLDQAGGALARLRREGHALRFVGPCDGLGRKLQADDADFDCTGELEFGDWQPAVSRIGVGVAPLADTAFNACKSWLKPLEYSAAGVPWVASPTVEYRRLARLCGAPTASRPRDWYRELKALASDAALREDASGRAREAARGLTVEGHAHEWAEAWSDALRLEREAAGARAG